VIAREDPPAGAEQQPVSAEDTTRAILNILEDFTAERLRLDHTQKAILNILEDFAAEKGRLEATQKAMINILDDFDAEKVKVEKANEELRRENAERALAEEALREKTQALARSNADLEQFAYVASHDLQEPLRMVASYTQLLARRYRGQLDQDADEFIGFAVDGARRMQDLINDLLAYSRAGTRPLRLEPVDTTELVDNLVAELGPAIQEAGARVTRGELPTVRGDTTQLRRLFQNLIANAIKFRGQRPPEVHLSAERQADGWRFSVQDNGIGIEPQYLERIFVLFQRLHTRAEYPGTGIGLAICKKIVERHGGQIGVESEPDQGTTFWFTLPFRPAGAEA
jgi:light-regulated signal transduction histidine kinase (bacteriophytochrome)